MSNNLSLSQLFEKLFPQLAPDSSALTNAKEKIFTIAEQELVFELIDGLSVPSRAELATKNSPKIMIQQLTSYYDASDINARFERILMATVADFLSTFAARTAKTAQ
ncbi:hypothetical protein KBC79_06535 [Candidatus Woesebacteria bacterium]|nr:hypothetical protein [Candidatus Woesebacteria bacterium]